MSIFEQATRQALRFPSPSGELTTEQLWDLSLTSTNKNKLNLNSIAVAVNNELKSLGEENFVETATDARRAPLTLKLEILKHIIAIRKAENEEDRNRTQRRLDKEKLLNILEGKKAQQLAELSVEELEARVAAMS